MPNLQVLGGGEEAFLAILRHIEAAASRIEIHAFLWHDDQTGNKLGLALLQAAERGVEVVIHKDRVAAVYELCGGNNQSFFHKDASRIERLQARFLALTYRRGKGRPDLRQRTNQLVDDLVAHSKVTVSWSKKRFDHSKLFIFDGEILVLGSMGIGDEHHDEWIDMMIEVHGSEPIERLRLHMNGSANFDQTRRVDFLVHTQQAHPKKTCPMLNHRLALIDSAAESLVIEMAYLGDKRFTTAMVNAVKRGVDVTLVTGAEANLLQSLGLATCAQLMKRSGAPENLRIVLHPKMVHAKFVVVDHRYSDVGSANFTKLSHGVYDEVNLYVDDVDFARQLTEHAMAHCEGGQVVQGKLSFKKLVSRIERATVAYQSRKGG